MVCVYDHLKSARLLREKKTIHVFNSCRSKKSQVSGSLPPTKELVGIVIQNRRWEISSSIKIRWILNVFYFFFFFFSYAFLPQHQVSSWPVLISYHDLWAKGFKDKEYNNNRSFGADVVKIDPLCWRKKRTPGSQIDWSELPRSCATNRTLRPVRIGPK